MSDVQLLDELGRLWKPSIVYGRNEIVWNTRNGGWRLKSRILTSAQLLEYCGSLYPVDMENRIEKITVSLLVPHLVGDVITYKTTPGKVHVGWEASK